MQHKARTEGNHSLKQRLQAFAEVSSHNTCCNQGRRLLAVFQQQLSSQCQRPSQKSRRGRLCPLGLHPGRYTWPARRGHRVCTRHTKVGIPVVGGLSDAVLLRLELLPWAVAVAEVQRCSSGLPLELCPADNV
eukprot:2651080-Amphidinium_carterae.1